MRYFATRQSPSVTSRLVTSHCPSGHRSPSISHSHTDPCPSTSGVLQDCQLHSDPEATGCRIANLRDRDDISDHDQYELGDVPSCGRRNCGSHLVLIVDQYMLLAQTTTLLTSVDTPVWWLRPSTPVVMALLGRTLHVSS